jgi:hypothetical protein
MAQELGLGLRRPPVHQRWNVAAAKYLSSRFHRCATARPQQAESLSVIHPWSSFASSAVPAKVNDL